VNAECEFTGIHKSFTPGAVLATIAPCCTHGLSPGTARPGAQLGRLNARCKVQQKRWQLRQPAP
jgi:hypothetical protein